VYLVVFLNIQHIRIHNIYNPFHESASDHIEVKTWHIKADSLLSLCYIVKLCSPKFSSLIAWSSNV